MADRMPLWAIVVHAGLTCACERGCLARRIEGMRDAEPSFLETIDCPDGLARCRGGNLEESRLAQVSPRAPEGCPWVATGTCPGECVENVIVPAASAGQLCRSDGGVFKAERRSALPDECNGGVRWVCTAARVVDCPAKQALAVCSNGCALAELDDEVGEDDAITVLCRR